MIAIFTPEQDTQLRAMPREARCISLAASFASMAVRDIQRWVRTAYATPADVPESVAEAVNAIGGRLVAFLVAIDLDQSFIEDHPLFDDADRMNLSIMRSAPVAARPAFLGLAYLRVSTQFRTSGAVLDALAGDADPLKVSNLLAFVATCIAGIALPLSQLLQADDRTRDQLMRDIDTKAPEVRAVLDHVQQLVEAPEVQ